VSTPVDSIWAHPPTLVAVRAHWPALAAALDVNAHELAKLLEKHEEREFLYLKRHAAPDLAERVMALGIPGVALQREYRRYYPLGPVAGHVLGFTNVDDIGQEGIELAYDSALRAIPGQKRVLKDLQGNVIEAVESVVLPKPGRDLVLSLDRHVQYLAYRELKSRAAQFVPGHPIAGAEHSGVAAARADLYHQRKVVLTPLPENSERSIRRVRAAWRLCGARLLSMRPAEHDRVFAAVSHLPHLLSYALVDQVARHPNAKQLFDYAAGGFRDFTRIASSHPEMWRDICVANRKALLAELSGYQRELAEVKQLLQKGDALPKAEPWASMPNTGTW